VTRVSVVRHALVGVTCALALAGCAGGQGADARSGPQAQSGSHPSIRGDQNVAGTRATQPPPASAEQVLAGFARVYINWTAADVSSRMGWLARASTGQARSEMELAAAETQGDSTLKQAGIANLGTVEAIAPLRGRPDEFVVVTREATTATSSNAYQGLAPAWHLTVATVSLLRMSGVQRWIVSGWQPEN